MELGRRSRFSAGLLLPARSVTGFRHFASREGPGESRTIRRRQYISWQRWQCRHQKKPHVPRFGDWDRDNVPYTTYFDNARKDKDGGKPINPNDPEENPDAFPSVLFSAGREWGKQRNSVDDTHRIKFVRAEEGPSGRGFRGRRSVEKRQPRMEDGDEDDDDKVFAEPRRSIGDHQRVHLDAQGVRSRRSVGAAESGSESRRNNPGRYSAEGRVLPAPRSRISPQREARRQPRMVDGDDYEVFKEPRRSIGDYQQVHLDAQRVRHHRSVGAAESEYDSRRNNAGRHSAEGRVLPAMRSRMSPQREAENNRNGSSIPKFSHRNEERKNADGMTVMLKRGSSKRQAAPPRLSTGAKDPRVYPDRQIISNHVTLRQKICCCLFPQAPQ